MVAPTQHEDAPATGHLPFPPPRLSSDVPPEYAEFWRLWGEERFYACHEVLEELWRTTRGPQRWFYNGLINGAVAVYQHRRGSGVGACRQLVRAGVKLHPFRPLHDEVDIDGFLAGIAREVAASYNRLSAGQREQLKALPPMIEQRMAPDFPEGLVFEGSSLEELFLLWP